MQNQKDILQPLNTNHNQNQSINQKFDQNQTPDQLDDQQLIELIGGSGHYQKLYTLVFIIIWLSSTSTFLSAPILYQQVDLKCYNPKTKTYYKCTENNGGCDQTVIQIYDNTYNTMTSQFRLFCDKKWIRQYAQVNIYIGGISGVFMSSYLADNYGRRMVLIYGQILQSILTIFTPIVDNIYFQLVNTFVISGFILAIYNIHFTFVNESSAVKTRQIIILVLCFSYSFGSIVFTYLFQLLKDWKTVTILLVTVPSIICNLQYFFIQETPLYLFQQQKGTELIQVMNKIAKINNRSNLVHAQYDFQFVESNQTQESQISYIDLFKKPRIRVISICCIISYFASNNLYYGINFSLQNIGLGIYFNTIIVQVGELIGYLINYLVIAKTPRKKYSIISIGCVCLVNLLIILIKVPKNKSGFQVFVKCIQVLLACLAKLIISIYSSIVQIYYTELFPTEIRTQGTGIVNSIGFIGVIVLPYIVDFADQQGFSPLIILSIVGLIGFFSLFFLNETLNKPLPHTIEQIEAQNKQIVEHNSSYQSNQSQANNQSQFSKV